MGGGDEEEEEEEEEDEEVEAMIDGSVSTSGHGRRTNDDDTSKRLSAVIEGSWDTTDVMWVRFLMLRRSGAASESPARCAQRSIKIDSRPSNALLSPAQL